jgi:hypothetical protein
MDIFKPLVTTDELNRILEKKTLSLEDRFKIDSFTAYTLVETIGDLKNEELNEVYYLEAKNIYKVLNTVAYLLGIFDESEQFMNRLMCDTNIQAMLNSIDGGTSDKEVRQEARFVLFAKYVLSLTPTGTNYQLKPVFDGKIPKKIFSFRQTSAEEWFENYVSLVLKIASKILIKMDAESAFTYVFCNIVWYLNKSQPFKYYAKSTDKNMNETIGRIFKEFIILVGGNSSYIKNSQSAPLYKDL